MQLQFQKKSIPCLHRVTGEVQTQEQTQEVRLTDGMPDIGRVLASWGQMLVRSKEWRSGAMSVNGGVMAWVLYQPEDGSEPRCVEAWIPFQMKWELPDTQHDGIICVQPLLRGVDARSTSARKLMVRAGISICGEAMVPDEMEVYSPEALPEDIRLLQKNYPLLLPCEAGEKAFLIDEVLEFPPSEPQPETILYYTVQPVLMEQKVMADKVIFRGTASLHIFYRGVDGQFHNWDLEMPFSQYAPLEQEYSSGAEARLILALTSLELEKGEQDRYIWKTGMIGQYLIYDHTMLEIVEDAYSPVRTVTPQTACLSAPSVLDMHVDEIHPTAKMDMDGMQILDVMFCPEHPRLYREGDQVIAEFAGTFRGLCYNPEGELEGVVKNWEASCSFPAASETKVRITMESGGKTQRDVVSGGDTLAADLPFTVTAVAAAGQSMITGLEIGEIATPAPDRPSVILRRADGETLWQIAKKCGSSVELIRKANALEGEPEGQRMLLIPVL